MALWLSSGPNHELLPGTPRPHTRARGTLIRPLWRQTPREQLGGPAALGRPPSVAPQIPWALSRSLLRRDYSTSLQTTDLISRALSAHARARRNVAAGWSATLNATPAAHPRSGSPDM
jgi:hypothetical protein